MKKQLTYPMMILVIFCAATGFFTNATKAEEPFLPPLPEGRTWIADIPHGETGLKKGHPVMTVLAEGPDEQQVLSRLQQNATRVYDAMAEA